MNQRLRVLVADDDAATRTAVARALKQNEVPVEVEQCVTGDEAAARLGGGFDCVFLDYSMPGKDGLSVLREARAAGNTTPVVLLTGMGSEDLAVEAMKAGATDYLSKSRMNAETLRQSLRYAMQLHRAQRAAAAAQAELRKNEERLGRIVATIADGLLILDLTGRYTFANATAERILGVPAEVITARTYRDPAWTRWWPDGRPVETEEHPFARISRTGEAFAPTEMVVRRPDGSEADISLSAAPLRDGAGRMEGVVATIRDVTTAKQAERALRESEERFSRIFNITPTAIMLSTLKEGRILDVNEALLALSGHAREELIGESVMLLGIWSSVAAREEHVRAIQEGGEIRLQEARFRSKSGQVFDVLGSAVRVDIQGLECILSLFYDITERKRAEESLRQSEERFRSLYNAVGGGILVQDRSGRIVDANPAACELLGVSLEALKAWSGNSDEWEAVHEDGTPFPAEEFPGMTAMRTGKPAHDVIIGGRRGNTGQRGWVLVNAEPMFDPRTGEVRAAVLTLIDVTQRKRAEEAMRASRRFIEQIVQTTPALLYIYDLAEGRNIYVNNEITSVLGYSAGQIAELGPSVMENLLHPDDREKVKRHHERLANSAGEVLSIEYRMRHTSGEWRWLYSRDTVFLSEANGRPRQVIGSALDVTERHRSEEALRQSEERFRSLFEQSRDGLFVAEQDGVFVQVNEAAGRMLGYSREEVIGQHIGDLIPAEDRPRLQESMRVLAERGEHMSEWTHIRKDGTRINTEVSAWVLPDGKLGAFMRDITERKRGEAALRESEDRYRRLVELSPDVIYIHCEGRIVFINTAGVKLLGAERPEQVLGWRVPEEIIHPDYRAQVEKRIDGLWEGRSAPLIEEKFMRVDGSAVDVEVAATPFVYGGKPAAQVIAHDITDRKRMEAALRESSERLSALIKASPLGITALDMEGRVSVWNPAAERVFGWTEAEVLNGRLPIVPDDKMEEFRMLLGRAMRGTGFTGVEVRRRRKDGGMVDVSLSTAPLRDAHGKLVGVLAMIEDITEAKRLKEQLLAAHRMETVGRLAGGIAHDFNNLLAVISGYSESLLRRLKEDDPLLVHAQEIHRAADRGAGLTKQLLAFSRRQAIKPQIVDLNQTLSGVLQMLSRVISNKIHIRLETDVEGATVRADPGQMEQVVINLAVNARDAMPDGGDLVLRTRQCVLDTAAAVTQNLPPGDYVALEVADTGCGMDAEVQAHIFEPFFTTKTGKGTGLGLSIVYGIVQQAGGSVAVESAPGRGTTFTILLPRARRRVSEPSLL